MTTDALQIRPTRRTLLKSAAAFGAAGLVPARGQNADVDVVVVGAGAAGIGAALALQQKGLRYRLFEAAGRVGGRALTDTTTFRKANGGAVPFDIGCAWIHRYRSGDPFADWSRKLGFDTQAHSLSVDRLFYGDTPFSSLMVKMLGEDEERFIELFKQAGDVPASSVVKDWQRPMDAAATYMGPMDMAVDFDRLSTADFTAMADYEPNYLVREGYGTLVRRVALESGIKAELGTPVTAIDRSGAGVTVTTGGLRPGTTRAKAVIVTVSLGVLQSGAIRFAQPLPPATEQAIQSIQMGLLAKIPLQIPGIGHYLDGIWPYDNVIDESKGLDDIYFLAWPWDSDLMVGFVGGTFGWELSRAGERAAVDFAKKKLADLLGSSVVRHVQRGLLTPWATDKFARGAYSAASPGHHASRAVLAQPVEEKLYFAGEATAPDGMFATCSGAYMAGQAAVGAIAATIKAE